MNSILFDSIHYVDWLSDKPLEDHISQIDFNLCLFESIFKPIFLRLDDLNIKSKLLE